MAWIHVKDWIFILSSNHKRPLDLSFHHSVDRDKDHPPCIASWSTCHSVLHNLLFLHWSSGQISRQSRYPGARVTVRWVNRSHDNMMATYLIWLNVLSSLCGCDQISIQRSIQSREVQNSRWHVHSKSPGIKWYVYVYDTLVLVWTWRILPLQQLCMYACVYIKQFNQGWWCRRDRRVHTRYWCEWVT